MQKIFVWESILLLNVYGYLVLGIFTQIYTENLILVLKEPPRPPLCTNFKSNVLLPLEKKMTLLNKMYTSINTDAIKICYCIRNIY
jgi:hypothetical protein